MLKLLRYMHLNPVRAGLCKSVEDYKWSSDIYYRKNINSFVNTRVVFEMLDKNMANAIQNYREFMNEVEEENYSKLDAIGEEAYVILCSSKKEEKRRKRLEEILIETGISIEDYKLIKTGSRKRRLTEYKMKFIQASIRDGYTYCEIGKSIGMTDSAIYNILERCSNTISG